MFCSQLTALHEQLSDTAQRLLDLHAAHAEQGAALDSAREQSATAAERAQTEIEALHEELNNVQVHISLN